MRAAALLVLFGFCAPLAAQPRLAYTLELGGDVRGYRGGLSRFVDDYNRVNADFIENPFRPLLPVFGGRLGARVFVDRGLDVFSAGVETTTSSLTTSVDLTEDGRTVAGGRDLRVRVRDVGGDVEYGLSNVRLFAGGRLRRTELTSTQRLPEGDDDGAALNGLSGVYEGSAFQAVTGLSLCGYLPIGQGYGEVRLRVVVPVLGIPVGDESGLSAVDPETGDTVYFPSDFEAWLDGERGAGNAVSSHLHDLQIQLSLAVGLWGR